MGHKKTQNVLGRSYVPFVLLVLLCVICFPVVARADLSQKQARKAIQTVAGWSLPNDAVRIQSIQSNSAETAVVRAQIEAVFRVRFIDGHWELREIRVAPDRWEQLEVIARAAQVSLPAGECEARSTELTNKRARCLVAALFGVALPSDEVRIKEISPFALSLGSELSALVVAFVEAQFRLGRDARTWRVMEFKSGNRDWASVANLAAGMDQAKRSAASEDLSTIAKALGNFHRDRGYFVVSDKESVLIDHLNPRYLARVIRVDPWHRPYQYDGQQDRYSLRSFGPDGKPNTPDDIVVSGP